MNFTQSLDLLHTNLHKNRGARKVINGLISANAMSFLADEIKPLARKRPNQLLKIKFVPDDKDDFSREVRLISYEAK
ncbi:MAG: hypothetical protein SFU91_12995 [Chloroherpetonaceae bacterium]|nr:hypothetical protein [Chloroherpetonaceae bacterium]